MAAAKQLCDTNSWADTTSKSKGVIFARSEVTIGEVRDGTSNTMLIGEKYLMIENYENGAGSDNEPIYTGADWDTYRLATSSYMPYQDRSGYLDSSNNFGSVHAGGFGVVLCDGSVQSISYSIDVETWTYFAQRNDGKVISLQQ